jgi:hypothetical protein
MRATEFSNAVAWPCLKLHICRPVPRHHQFFSLRSCIAPPQGKGSYARIVVSAVICSGVLTSRELLPLISCLGCITSGGYPYLWILVSRSRWICKMRLETARECAGQKRQPCCRRGHWLQRQAAQGSYSWSWRMLASVQSRASRAREAKPAGTNQLPCSCRDLASMWRAKADYTLR